MSQVGNVLRVLKQHSKLAFNAIDNVIIVMIAAFKDVSDENVKCALLWKFSDVYGRLIQHLSGVAWQLDNTEVELANKQAMDWYNSLLNERPDMRPFLKFNKLEVVGKARERLDKIEQRLKQRFYKTQFGVNSREEFMKEYERMLNENNYYDKVGEDILVRVANDRRNPLRFVAREALETGVLRLKNAALLMCVE